jgi:hypothetical protein
MKVEYCSPASGYCRTGTDVGTAAGVVHRKTNHNFFINSDRDTLCMKL